MINRPLLARLRMLSLIEGVSTLVLFGIAMPLKYLADMPMAVTIVGSLHGLLFILLVMMLAWGRTAIPIPMKVVVAGIVGAVVPFGPFVVDATMLRKVAQAE